MEREEEEEEEESRQKESSQPTKEQEQLRVRRSGVGTVFRVCIAPSELCTPTKETKKYYDLGVSGKSVFIAALTGKLSAGGSEI